MNGECLTNLIVAFFTVTLLILCALFAAGWRAGFAFFIWSGILGLAVIAQFWAFAADTFNLKNGQRLFPIIMIGADYLSPAGLMLVATGGLLLTVGFSRPASRVVSDAAFPTSFFANFQFWVTLLGIAIQLFLVARIYRRVGLRGALLVMPVIVAIGYGLLVFVPIFAMIQVVKILEDSVDYTLMNTTRQVLFLPVPRAAKYDGKTAIDTFFWRLGDLVQAAFVFAGIGRHYARLASQYVLNIPPEVRRPIPDTVLEPGDAVRIRIADDTFFDADPGGVLRFHARLADGRELPAWLRFNTERRQFHGVVPEDAEFELTVEVFATDIDGSVVSSRFTIRCGDRVKAF